MTILFLILIVVSTIVLGFIILVQNPKGGGLAGNIAGFNNQFMGVKQTNDVLERGTWIFAIVIALLCLFSSFFMTAGSGSRDNIIDRINTNTPAQQQQQQPAQPQPMQPAPQNAQPPANTPQQP